MDSTEPSTPAPGIAYWAGAVKTLIRPQSLRFDSHDPTAPPAGDCSGSGDGFPFVIEIEESASPLREAFGLRKGTA